MASHEQEDLAPPDVVLLQQEGLRSNPLPSAQSSSSPAFSVNASSSSIINIAYINCVGQTKLTLSKQLEIQSYMKSHRVDILHLQECMIDNDSFGDCNYVRSNFNIFSNNTPNNTQYGTASLVRSDIDVTNIVTDDSGRVIIFDAVGCTWGNLYLPSGTDGASRNLREHYCAEVLPQLMLQRKCHGAIGGDLNSIISSQDSNRNPNTKMSPSFKTLVSSFSLTDSFRELHPKKVNIRDIIVMTATERVPLVLIDVITGVS